MSVTLSLFRIPARHLNRLLDEADFAQSLVGEPEDHGAVEFDSDYDLSHRDLEEHAAGKKWLSKVTEDTGVHAGEDFGYGPGIVFGVAEVAALAKGLASEWKRPVAPLRELIAFFAAAAKAKQFVMLTAA